MTDNNTGNRITDLDEANRIINTMRIKLRNQRKHLRWFNRLYDSYTRGTRQNLVNARIILNENELRSN